MSKRFLRSTKQMLSAILAAVMVLTAVPEIPAKAQETEGGKYPYTLFAGSEEDGAITVNAGNFCVNGSVATNGTIVADGNLHVNGEKKENACEEMIYIPNRVEQAYFADGNLEVHGSDYSYEDTNIHVNVPVDVEGKLEFTGNVNINSGVRAEDDIVLHGGTASVNDTVVYAERGDIVIDGNNVNLTGLLYAPYGEVVLTAQNMNLNSVIIIADKIVFECPNVNANYSSKMAEVVGTVSEDVGDGASSDGEDVSEGDVTDGGIGDTSGGDVSVGDVSEGDVVGTVTELYAVGKYNEAAHSIDVQWHSNGTCDGYDVLASDDGEKYTSVGVVAEGNRYQYVIEEAFEEKYFKVTAFSGQETVVESLPFTVKWTEDGYEVIYLDSDKDGLEDVFELAFGSDRFVSDTDGDTLTDYQEVWLVGTDVLVYDSVCEGVSDAEADGDGDGLNSVQEMEYGTDIRKEDTDHDTLTDYEEVMLYQTNPLEWDSDEDTLSDSDEIRIGLNPNNPRTYGVPDAEYQVEQSISADSEVFKGINTEESPYKLSVDITAAGNAEANLNVRVSGYAAAIQNDAMLGVAPELIYAGNEQVESVTLKFEVEDSYIEDSIGLFPGEEELEGIKRFNVFKFYEEEGALLPIATEFDVENNCIYAKTDETGTYCVMDMELWLAGFAEAVEAAQAEDLQTEAEKEQVAAYDLRSVSAEALSAEMMAAAAEAGTDAESGEEGAVTTRIKPVEAVFMLQAAGKQSTDFFYEKRMIVSLLRSLKAVYGQNVKFSVIVFDVDGAEVLTTASGNIWFTDATVLENKLDAVTYKYTTKYVYRHAAYLELMSKIDFSYAAAKFSCLIVTGNTENSYDETSVLSGLYVQGVHCSLIHPTNFSYSDLDFQKDITRIMEKSGGMVKSFGRDTETLLYNQMCQYAEETISASEFSVIVPTGWQEIVLEAPLNRFSRTNSDTDGRFDLDEVQENLLNWDAEGNPILPTISEAYGGYSQEGFERFKSELWAAGMPSSEFEKYFDNILNTVRILPINSDPTSPDSDCDGLDDDVEHSMGTKPFTIDTDYDLADDGEEYFMGLSPRNGDTDGDGLWDGKELELGYDPLDRNPDDDSFDDMKEYLQDSDPFVFEHFISYESAYDRFCYGMIYGDFVKDEEVDGCILVGQIASGFVPFVADGRDAIANFQKGDWVMALLSSASFVPIAGDSLKVIGDLGQTVKKVGDDTPTLVKLLVKTSDDHPWIAKFLGENELVAAGVKEGLQSPNITQKNWDKLLKMTGNLGDGPVDVGKIIDIIPRRLKEYGKCDAFAKSLVKALNKFGLDYKIIRVDSRYSIYSDKFQMYIGVEFHYGVQIGDVVYDNMTPDGMQIKDWLDDLGLAQGYPGISWKYVTEIK